MFTGLLGIFMTPLINLFVFIVGLATGLTTGQIQSLFILLLN